MCFRFGNHLLFSFTGSTVVVSVLLNLNGLRGQVSHVTASHYMVLFSIHFSYFLNNTTKTQAYLSMIFVTAEYNLGRTLPGWRVVIHLP